ncbi:hypothetical protein HNP46_006088 [Pseudomonas nitritireducens]|uniref:Lipoprotein n=1 Tax=Pseudomonas nitroreducens TaxID=46680 RepID=A0A7W7KQK9_PSENT|nr:hypothetical protein [Pseudomonas nitritireducens]MBB4867177.1 hypothetical protein [Pseudomonas nitritireducens]
MTKYLRMAAVVATAALILSGCAGSSMRADFDAANSRSLIHLPVAAAQTPVKAQQPGARSIPKIEGEQALLDPSSVVRSGNGVSFNALDGQKTARVTFNCPSRTGQLRENGLMQTFSLVFTPRLTKAALEACGELPMPEPLTAAQKKLINPNPTQADKDNANTAYFCGSFMSLPLDQKLALIDRAQSNPRLHKQLEPCMEALHNQTGR